MPKLLVEVRIREKYQAGGGDWVVEKGKVAECKLLKEAVERIESQRKTIVKYHGMLVDDSRSIDKRTKELRDELAAKEAIIKRMKNSLNRATSALEYSLKEMQELTNWDTPNDHSAL